MHGDRCALAAGRKVVSVRIIADGDGFNRIFLVVRDNVDLNGSRFARFGVQLPYAEVLLVDDGFAVAGNRWEKRPAAFMVRYLNCVSTVLVELPQIIRALENFMASRLDM